MDSKGTVLGWDLAEWHIMWFVTLCLLDIVYSAESVEWSLWSGVGGVCGVYGVCSFSLQGV